MEGSWILIFCFHGMPVAEGSMSVQRRKLKNTSETVGGYMHITLCRIRIFYEAHDRLGHPWMRSCVQGSSGAVFRFGIHCCVSLA